MVDRRGILTQTVTARLALATAVAVLGLAASARAQAPLQLPGPSTVSAYRDTIAFSRLDLATHRWSLMLRTGDAVTTVDIAPRGVPFDVNLGPGADGRPVAVYSRAPVSHRLSRARGRSPTQAARGAVASL